MQLFVMAWMLIHSGLLRLLRRSAAARLLWLWFQIPPAAWTFVCSEFCMLSRRGLWDELITRPEGVPPTVMRRRVWSTNLVIPNHLWLRSNRRCITGWISYMPLIVTVKTIAECLRTDCNILGDNKKNSPLYILCTKGHNCGLSYEYHFGNSLLSEVQLICFESCFYLRRQVKIIILIYMYILVCVCVY